MSAWLVVLVLVIGSALMLVGIGAGFVMGRMTARPGEPVFGPVYRTDAPPIMPEAEELDPFDEAMTDPAKPDVRVPTIAED